MVYHEWIMLSGAERMKLSTTQEGMFGNYLSHYEGLIGDKWTGAAFRGIVQGSINSGSLVCQRIAAHMYD